MYIKYNKNTPKMYIKYNKTHETMYMKYNKNTRKNVFEVQ